MRGRMKDLRPYIHNYVVGLEEELTQLPIKAIQKAIQVITDCNESGGTVWLAGNGGSLALASHMAVDLQLAGIRAQALSDSTALSSYSNDNDWVEGFLYQLRALSKAGDVVILISTSGTSRNMVAVAEQIFSTGYLSRLTSIGLTGSSKGLYQSCDISILVGHGRSTPIIQDLQQTVLHLICYWLMKENERE